MLVARSHLQGINLIELLIALLIIGILAVAAIPLFTSFIQNYRISASANNLQASLQYARSEAIKRNTNVYVSFTTGDTWCYGINPDSACDCNTPSGCSLGTGSYGAAQQIALSTTGMTGNTLYFEGTHGAANASSSVTFTLYGNSSPLITLSINRLGNIQICSTGIGGYTAC